MIPIPNKYFRDLDLISSLNTAVPASVAAFYADTYATGTGPDGTLVITDLLGAAVGGAGVSEEDEPPQAATKTAETKTSNEARIECKNMNISCAEPVRPQILSEQIGDSANA